MKHIRNARHIPLLVPSLHVAADPDGTARIPDDAPIPDGWELVPKPDRTRTRKPQTLEQVEPAEDDKETD